MRPHIVERHGLPFWLHRYRRRVGAAAGAALAAAALIASQQFLWVVRVEGCERLPESQLLNALEELGVKRGAPKGKVDALDVQQRLLYRVDGVIWVALNIRGTTATLVVKERTMPPPKIDTNVPANVVAAQDGQIKRLEVTDARALLKVGDTVRAGEIIVTGVLEDRWGLTHLVRAGARVVADVPRTLEVKVPLHQQIAVPTGKVVKRRYLELGSVRLPLFLYRGLEGDYKVVRLSRAPELLGVELPFEVSRESYVFYEQQEETISQETALRDAERTLARREREEFGEDAVVSRQVKAAVENGTLVLRGEYLVETDIAVRAEIPVLDRRRDGG